MRLSVRPGHSVTVLGYGREPFLRLDGAGVTVLRSPTAAALGAPPVDAAVRVEAPSVWPWLVLGLPFVALLQQLGEEDEAERRRGRADPDRERDRRTGRRGREGREHDAV